ncbi:hypothetical protein CYMTET_52395 [Cymbomonas tetramitiformis]|uniref:NAD(P)-binding domain-containing protein n=1 Tax=Cymbomonas tetramitiformis TaxID=36881 RepID=A0AAE0BKX6_9CHLO|nr:hypothetical protein CYMTET_52395 [Cymbomonas tetramitiformis]
MEGSRSPHRIPLPRIRARRVEMTIVSSASADSVLVVGATGRVGRLIVRELSDKGLKAKCLARKPEDDNSKYLKTLPGVRVVEGDVTDAVSVRRAMDGCTKCIACFGAARIVKLSDFWRNGEAECAHPKSVNYRGVLNLIEAAKDTPDFEKFIRVTGLSVGVLNR